MISTLIVFSSIGLALIFSLAYWLSPSLRNKVEEPKYLFMEQLSQHNQSSNYKEGFSRDGDDAK
jgi:hypothetical protein